MNCLAIIEAVVQVTCYAFVSRLAGLDVASSGENVMLKARSSVSINDYL